MSTTTGYLVPAEQFKTGIFKEEILKVLNKLMIFNGYYDKDEDQFAAGINSRLLFEMLNNPNVAFEYSMIHDTKNRRLVPDSSSDGYGSTCSNCKQDIDEELYDVINNLYDKEIEEDIEFDMMDLTIKCSHCGNENKFHQVAFKRDAGLYNQYIQFIDIDGDFNLKKVNEIAAKMGCSFKIIYERM